MLVALYLFLLIPESPPPKPTGAGKQPFVWNRDQFWSALEQEFQIARSPGRDELMKRIDTSLEQIHELVVAAQTSVLAPDAKLFDEIEISFFHLAPMVAASPQRLPEFLES